MTKETIQTRIQLHQARVSVLNEMATQAQQAYQQAVNETVQRQGAIADLTDLLSEFPEAVPGPDAA